MSTNPIEFDGLCKTYRQTLPGKKVSAISNLSFSVPPGVIYGFLGANGAGKTTSIKILLGLQEASSGTAYIFGKPCTDETARARIGYLPERPYFHDNLTAEEFLNFHRQLYSPRAGASAKNPPLTNSALLELVGIPGTEKKLLRSFSKGMLQRAGIAQAVINDPELIILDEPMSGLDPVGRKDMRKLILDLSHQGKTIFFSTHILEDVESICDRIAFLEKGVLSYEGSLEKLLSVNSTDYEIIFSGISAEKISAQPALSAAAPHGNAWRIVAKGTEGTQLAIENIWQANGVLVSTNLLHRTLEEALFGLEKRKQA
jgi:ABC-2 type transport system ATP-binding protein